MRNSEHRLPEKAIEATIKEKVIIGSLEPDERLS